MTEKQTLEKAISIAIKNGWEPPHKNKIRVQDDPDFKLIEFCYSQEVFETWEYNTLLFNHGFAKALWGFAEKFKNKELQKLYHATHTGEDMWPAWKYHLQQMVIADDPIKYLNDNLTG